MACEACTVETAQALGNRLGIAAFHLLGDRQAASQPGGLEQGQIKVLGEAGDVERARLIGAIEGIDDHLGAVLQDRRPTGTVGDDRDRCLGRDARAFEDRHGLGKRLPVKRERQVDRQLHAGARTGWPKMFDPFAQLFQNRSRAVHRRLSPAGHAQKLTLERRSHRSSDRAIHELCAGCGHLCGDGAGLVGQQCRHVNDKLTGEPCGDEAVGNILHRLSIGQ